MTKIAFLVPLISTCLLSGCIDTPLVKSENSSSFRVVENTVACPSNPAKPTEHVEQMENYYVKFMRGHKWRERLKIYEPKMQSCSVLKWTGGLQDSKHSNQTCNAWLVKVEYYPKEDSKQVTGYYYYDGNNLVAENTTLIHSKQSAEKHCYVKKAPKPLK